MKEIFTKLQRHYSDEEVLINLSKENEITRYFKRELKIKTNEANLFGLILYHYIKDGFAVNIKDICEETGISQTEYLKIIDLIHKLEDKGLILTDEKRKRSSKMINPDIEVDEIIFKKIIYNEDLLSSCNFKDFYSIVETVEELIDLREDGTISDKYFLETIKKIISRTDKKLPLYEILNNYSLNESILFLYALAKNVDSWGSDSVSIMEFAEFMDYRLSKKMELLDKVIAESLKIFKDGILQLDVAEEQGLLSSSTDINIKISNDCMSKLLNRKIKNFKLTSKVLNHITNIKVNKELFFEDKFKKEMDKIKDFLTEKRFKHIKKELSEKGFSKGVVMLFYGVPGTGKTATAGKIAALTGRDILQVDFSQVQSKWVGESEKNMKRIFNEYSIALRNLKKEPILLFNEADSLISRRININDSVDQMNNTLQNILLEELENFEGILIATTNLIDNIDPAFDRRFIYKLKFDKPNKEIRKKIWKNKFPELNDRFVEKLSDYDLSGGQIENIVKKCVITKVLEMKQLELSEIIDYVKEELQFREATKRVVGFKNEK